MWVIKSIRMSRSGKVAHVGDGRDAYRVLVGRSDVDGRIMWVAWNGLMCLRIGTGRRLL